MNGLDGIVENEQAGQAEQGVPEQRSDGADRFRRGLYTHWQRSATYPTFVSFDLWFMLGSAALLTLVVVLRTSLGRAWGAALLAGYAIYLALVV